MWRLRHEKSLQMCISDLEKLSKEKTVLCFQNCRSLRKHYHTIKNQYNLLNCEVLTLTESRVFASPEAGFEIEHYNLYCAKKEECAHGISVY